MLIEAAKGGHTSVVCYLLDYPNNLLSAPPPDVTQLTPPSHDLNRVRFKTKSILYHIFFIPFLLMVSV